tara:strand:+ start:305719 stop:306027 length:309 start_codon:yes stop_codon:yes gene_type:complete
LALTRIKTSLNPRHHIHILINDPAVISQGFNITKFFVIFKPLIGCVIGPVARKRKQQIDLEQALFGAPSGRYPVCQGGSVGRKHYQVRKYVVLYNVKDFTDM